MNFLANPIKTEQFWICFFKKNAWFAELSFVKEEAELKLLGLRACIGLRCS